MSTLSEEEKKEAERLGKHVWEEFLFETAVEKLLALCHNRAKYLKEGK